MSPRPNKPRNIGNLPPVSSFVPEGVPENELLWIHLTLDEYEALKLIDEEGYDQEQAATLMGVSRPTVTRILARARTKLAQMLANAAALVIDGGNIQQRDAMQEADISMARRRTKMNWLTDADNCPNNRGEGRGRCRCQRGRRGGRGRRSGRGGRR